MNKLPDTLVNDDGNKRQDHGRSCLRVIVASLLLIIFATFSIAVSARCCLNDIAYESLWGVIGLFGILLLLKLTAEKTGTKQAVTLALAFFPFIFVFYYALLSFLIFTTSTGPVQFQTQVINIGRGRGCSTSYWTFDNKPIHREITICGDGIVSGARSSGAMTVTEKAGPFGAYIQHIDMIP